MYWRSLSLVHPINCLWLPTFYHFFLPTFLDITFFAHLKRLSYSVTITFMCTEKSKNVYNVLYCDIHLLQWPAGEPAVSPKHACTHEDVHRLHANTTPFYIRESSSRDFGFSGGWTSEQIPADTRRPLCFTFYTTSQSVLAVSSAQKPQVTRLAIKLKSARLDCVHMGCWICIWLFWESEKGEKQRTQEATETV